jgi:outer membrane protein assembly factor BamA
MNTPERFLRVARRTAMLLALLLVSLAMPRAGADDAPAFTIESITVAGASRNSTRIVIAESRLRAGESYGEPALRDAMARIQRLPFVVYTDFRLAKGSAPGKYILEITIKQTKAFFLTAENDTHWSLEDRIDRTQPPMRKIGTYVDQFTTSDLTLGTRAFVGAKGVVNLAAQRFSDRNDSYTFSYTQYDLFGTRASLTAVVSYLQTPIRKPTAPESRIDWHHRDNLTYELIGILPVAENDSLRGSWQHSERPLILLELPPETQRLRFALISRPQVRYELFWIHDTTNDPLFPTSGTRFTAGGTHTTTPTSGLVRLGRVKQEELKTTLERSWTLTTAQAATLGGSAYSFDNVIRDYRMFGRYSFDLWGRERTLKDGDLRLELEGDRHFIRVQRPPFRAESTLRLGLASRNVWGVLRLNVSYTAWRTP